MTRLGSLLLAAAVVGAAGLSACKKPPTPAEIYRDKGDLFLAKGQYKDAAEQYGLSLQADPTQDKIWEKKAFAHMKAGDTDLAAESLLKTLDRMTDPKDKAELYRKIASIYLEKGPLDKAENYFLEVLKIEPNDEGSLAWLGEIFSQQGGARNPKAAAVPSHLLKAIEYYDQAIKVNPNAAIPYVNKRIALFKLMNLDIQEKTAAEQEASQYPKDKVRVAAAKARAAERLAHAEELKRQTDELGQKIGELNKAAKAAKEAAAAEKQQPPVPK